MAKMAKRAPIPTLPYTPPQRRLGNCPTCACTVLADAWKQVQGTWQPQGPLWTPVLGDSHDCATALIDYAARWQYIVRLVEPRRFP
jgi:hypothetical protein